jgi:hypothetical protein
MTVLKTGITTVAPVSFASLANGNVIGVNGHGRGFIAIGGTTAYDLGITAPTSCTASSVTPPLYYISGVDVVQSGENYYTPPTVSITGCSGARATLIGDGVGSITVTTSATTYPGAPPVSLSGGQASGALAYATLRGGVAEANLRGGIRWGAPPAVTFSAATGATAYDEAQARVALRRETSGATDGPASFVLIEDPGDYEWDGNAVSRFQSPVNAAAAGGLIIKPRVSGVITAVTVTDGGANYTVPPSVVLTPDGNRREGSGAAAVASLNGTSAVQAVEIVSPGAGYSGRLTVSFSSPRASAVALMAPRLAGKYLLGWRYVAADGTRGDLCPLLTVDCGEGARSFSWQLPLGLPPRVSRIELWRTTSDQAITLYRVASLTDGGTFVEGLPDADLANPERNITLNGAESKYLELPILTSDGLPNAYRFGIPPGKMAVVTLFADRAWYAVDTTGAEPNTLYFSGVQEYESVPAENQVILQSTGKDSDSLTGLMPMGGALYACQRRSLVRLTVGAQPLLSASATPAAQRGLTNDRCWDQFEGIAYLADDAGVYAFDGASTDPISDPVATFWTSPTIDFSKKTWFFLRVNHAERVVRFYFSAVGQSGDYPRSALCYSLTTKAWWLEEYDTPLSCGVRVQRNGVLQELAGSEGSLMQTSAGLTDNGQPIQYVLRTGAMPLTDEPQRAVRVVYTPTSDSHTLNARLYYNNSATPRSNAIASDRGTGFVTDTGSTQATLDMAATRSPLGEAVGSAQFSLAGRLDDRSAGGDRYVALELAGEQSTSRPTIHRLDVKGAG